MGDKRLFEAGLLWGLALAVLSLTAMTAASSAAEAEEFADPSLLVSTEALESLLVDLDIRILDLRPTDRFQLSHIPYALSLPAAAVMDSASRIKGRRADAELAQMFGQLGIRRDSLVVLYDARGSHDAARVLWLLHYLGHDRVSVLDGGFQKWRDEGRYLTQETRQVKREYFPLDVTPRRLATAEWILDHLQDPDLIILNADIPEIYAKGHIPGAINIPWPENLEADRAWKSPGKLQRLYEGAGVTKDKNIVIYCEGGDDNGGHTYLTLKALGYPRVLNYDRGWLEWGKDPYLPRDVGPAPGSAPTGVQGQSQAGKGLELKGIGLIVGSGVLLALLGVIAAALWRLSHRQESRRKTDA